MQVLTNTEKLAELKKQIGKIEKTALKTQDAFGDSQVMRGYLMAIGHVTELISKLEAI
jgi:hypothetical protein